MIGPVRFTPPWLDPARLSGAGAGAGKKRGGKPAVASAPVFLLHAGAIIDRDLFEAELEGRHNAGTVLPFELLEAASAGLSALLGDDAAELQELLRADFAAATEGPPLSPAEQAKVRAATQILARSWPDYAALVEREARRAQILPTLAFVQWCQGWENLADRDGAPIAYVRDHLGQLDEELLRRIPFTVIRSVGLAAYSLQYGRLQTKN